MKWLRLPQLNGDDAFVTTTSIEGIATMDCYTQVLLSNGNSITIDGKYTPNRILEVIKNSRDIDQPFEIIELI